MRKYSDFALTAKSVKLLEDALVAAKMAHREKQTDDEEGTVKGRFVSSVKTTRIRPIYNDDGKFNDEGDIVQQPTLRYAAYTCLRLNGGAQPPVIKGVTIELFDPLSGLPGWGENPQIEVKEVEIPTPANTPLSPVQFDAIVRLLGLSMADIDTIIDKVLKNPAENAVAKAKLHKSDLYRRDNPLFRMLGPALGKSDAEIDMAWMMAAEIE